MTSEIINIGDKIAAYRYYKQRYEAQLRNFTDANQRRIIQQKIDEANLIINRLQKRDNSKLSTHKVINTVCNYFNISVSDFSKNRPLIAKKLAINFLYNYFEFDNIEIAAILNESPQNVSKHRIWLLHNWTPKVENQFNDIKTLLEL